MNQKDGPQPSAELHEAEQLMEAMHRLHQAWGKFQPNPPLKRSEMFMLANIDKLGKRWPDKPVTVSRLAHYLHQSVPGVSQKVSLLEQAGLVRRTADADDRRVAFVQLTAKGRQAADAAWQGLVRRMAQALQTLGPKKTEQLLVLMLQLNTAIEEQAAAENSGATLP